MAECTDLARKDGNPTRRSLFGAALAMAAVPAAARAEAARDLFDLAELRGSVNATQHGLRPGAVDDQSRRLQKLLDKASAENSQIFLPPGDYHVANIRLPERTRIVGVPGATRLVYGGGGHFLMSENARHLELAGLVLDGANRQVESYAEACLRITSARHAVVDNCLVVGASQKAMHIERSAGRIERCAVTGAAGECGIYALESRGLAIVGNEVNSCSNGGILVHRWQDGEDGTVVTGNRVFNIGAINGGTGQWGNGINIFRAHSVMVANNQISECAFSAIRSNAGSNAQILGNNCRNSGETAIYSEFEFNGAVISGNVVDGGARGIAIANFMQGGRMAVCSGNLVRNIRQNAPYADKDHPFGIGISAEADTAISANVVEGAERFGLLLGWGPYLRDVVATGNVIRGSETGVYVSVVEGARNAVISGNVITGWSKGAIVGHRWQQPATGDMGLGDNFGFRHLAVEQNRVS